MLILVTSRDLYHVSKVNLKDKRENWGSPMSPNFCPLVPNYFPLLHCLKYHLTNLFEKLLFTIAGGAGESVIQHGSLYNWVWVISPRLQ